MAAENTQVGATVRPAAASNSRASRRTVRALGELTYPSTWRIEPMRSKNAPAASWREANHRRDQRKSVVDGEVDRVPTLRERLADSRATDADDSTCWSGSGSCRDTRRERPERRPRSVRSTLPCSVLGDLMSVYFYVFRPPWPAARASLTKPAKLYSSIAIADSTYATKAAFFVRSATADANWVPGSRRRGCLMRKGPCLFMRHGVEFLPEIRRRVVEYDGGGLDRGCCTRTRSTSVDSIRTPFRFT